MKIKNQAEILIPKSYMRISLVIYSLSLYIYVCDFKTDFVSLKDKIISNQNGIRCLCDVSLFSLSCLSSYSISVFHFNVFTCVVWCVRRFVKFLYKDFK